MEHEDYEQSVILEIACLQSQLEAAQKKVNSLKRRIRGFKKHLEEITAPDEPITNVEDFQND